MIVKDATDFIAPAWLLAIRFITAALILAVAFIGKRSLYLKKEYVGIGLLFGVAMFVAYYLQTVGVMYTTPGKNAFLTGVYCVLVPFIAWGAMRKRPSWFNLLAALLCIAGVGLLSLNGEAGINIGDVLTLGCAVFYAIHIVLVARFSVGRDIYVLTMWQFAGVGLCALFVALLSGSHLPAFNTFDASQVCSLAYLAVFCTALALLFQNMGQKHLPPASASLLLSLESPFGVAFSVAFGYDVLTLRSVAGFALIFIAILVSEVLPEKLRAKSA